MSLGFKQKHSVESLFLNAPGMNIEENIGNKPIKFFFFGCWNDKIKMTGKIISKLDESFRFGLVNGDNFYPTKIESDGIKKKLYDDMPDKINEGFKILKKFPNNIFISLGNHEVDNPTPCDTLISEIKKSQGSNLIIPTNYYSVNVFNDSNDRLKIFVLDVNLLEENLCYDETSREEHKSKMVSWLSSNIQNIRDTDQCVYVVMGHYPLFYFNKKGNFIVNETTKDILQILKSISPMKIYYLASDVHNFQYIEHENIHQFIVGTGGAKLDDIPEMIQNDAFLKIEIAVKEGIFKIHSAKKTYGHLILTLNKMSLGHMFDSVVAMDGGNFMTKFCKYSSKTEEILNMLGKSII